MIYIIRFICILLIKHYLFIETVDSYPENILNIANDIDDQISMHYHEKIPGASTTTYLASRENNVIKVIEGACTIWEAKIPGTRLSLLKIYRRHGLNKLAYVYSVGGPHFYTRYYEKFGDSYRKIPQSQFQYKLERLLKERCIDLEDEIDPSIYMIQHHNIYGLQAHVIIPYEQFEIISVSYGFDTLWEQKFGRGKCSCIIVHGKLDDIQLIHLHIKHSFTHGEIFYTNFNGVFKPVTKDYFYHVLNNMDSEEKRKFKNESNE